MTIPLSFAVQYAVPAQALPRWRLRRWAQRALNAAVADLSPGHDDAPCSAELTLRLVGSDESAQLNAAYRDRDYPTNVLTFEYGTDPAGVARGDIVLCVPVLEREAADQGKPLLHHAAHLVIHGVLHALGYDHIDPDEAAHMEELETRLLAAQGIPDPYAPGNAS